MQRPVLTLVGIGAELGRLIAPGQMEQIPTAPGQLGLEKRELDSWEGAAGACVGAEEARRGPAGPKAKRKGAITFDRSLYYY